MMRFLTDISDTARRENAVVGPTVDSQPLRVSKVSHMVAAAVVEDIVSEGLQAGDRLPPEAAMLKRFQVGRASIREGLRLLETYGVISIRPGQRGGPVVAPLDAHDVARAFSLFLRLVGASYRDLIDARLVIEPVMARLAAERSDRERLQELRGVMDRERSAVDDRDYLSLANEFHYAVNGASGNPVLDLLGQALRVMYSDRLNNQGLFPPEARAGVRTTHAEIGSAILEGYGKKAEALMKDHMEDLAALQAERTPWFMDDRVVWES
jgi:GntR family transcriptional regulator, transcriptional repressor for pyruvate dehydrogenase complex